MWCSSRAVLPALSILLGSALLAGPAQARGIETGAASAPASAVQGAVSAYSKVPACILKGKQLAGRVYIETSQYSATFKVYQGSSRYSTDLSVYRTSSRYDTTSCGRWYFTNSKYDANFSVYFVSSKYSADFSIVFTSSKYSAGVN